MEWKCIGGKNMSDMPEWTSMMPFLINLIELKTNMCSFGAKYVLFILSKSKTYVDLKVMAENLTNIRILYS